MKPESQINQKQLLAEIKQLNETFNLKIKTKGSITQLAEAFAGGVEVLNEQGEGLPESTVDFFNDLFADESAGYKDVEVKAGGKAEEETEDPVEETEPLDEETPTEEEEVEELDELDPEEELPGEDEEETLDEEEELEELEEEDDKPTAPKKRGRGRPVGTTKKKAPPPPPAKKTQPKGPAPKAVAKKNSEIGRKETNPPKEEPTMLEQLQSLTKKPEVKAFVATNNLNIKLKNNESVTVWKAKVKKLLESACPAPAETTKPAAKATAKAVKKPVLKAKVEKKAPAKAKTTPEPKKPEKKAAVKPEKKAKAPRTKGEGKDPFGFLMGSLTHSFVTMVAKKPCTMGDIVKAGLGKHPKTVKKLVAMGYMNRNDNHILTLTPQGKKVWGETK
jgi:hypothetical protein